MVNENENSCDQHSNDSTHDANISEQLAGEFLNSNDSTDSNILEVTYKEIKCALEMLKSIRANQCEKLNVLQELVIAAEVQMQSDRLIFVEHEIQLLETEENLEDQLQACVQKLEDVKAAFEKQKEIEKDLYNVNWGIIRSLKKQIDPQKRLFQIESGDSAMEQIMSEYKDVNETFERIVKESDALLMRTRSARIALMSTCLKKIDSQRNEQYELKKKINLVELERFALEKHWENRAEEYARCKKQLTEFCKLIEEELKQIDKKMAILTFTLITMETKCFSNGNGCEGGWINLDQMASTINLRDDSGEEAASTESHVAQPAMEVDDDEEMPDLVGDDDNESM